jgi:hypothetical protein
MIAPALQAKMAARVGAKVTKLPTSHLAMLADPKGVTAVILAAADACGPGSQARRARDQRRSSDRPGGRAGSRAARHGAHRP